MHLIGALILAAIIGAVAVSYLGRVTGRVADHGTPAAQRVARGSRRAARNGRQRAQHGVAEIWAEVRAADWLERRRNARAARKAVGRATGRGAMATARGLGRATRAAGRATGRGVVRGTRAIRSRRPAGAQPPASPLPAAPPAPRPDAPRPERAPVPMTTPTNGTAPVPGGGADLFTAIQQVTNHAMSGGLRSKQRAFQTLEDAFDYISQQLSAFARQLSEPGQEYPASIWEPLAKAAAHVKAASSAAGESSSGIGALANMNLGEAADSPVHVPHNTQLNAPR